VEIKTLLTKGSYATNLLVSSYCHTEVMIMVVQMALNARVAMFLKLDLSKL